MRKADIIVVGGGSAGAVMAARLSESPAHTVLLIEAGTDTPPNRVPADIRDIFPTSFFNRDYFWPNTTTAIRAGEVQRPYLQARVMGGGSSVMGMLALRGLPADYDGWEAAGARNWSWRDVLPAFKALTRDLDADQRESNQDGPNIVRRISRNAWAPYMRQMEEVVKARGMASLPDVYASADDGFFALPLSQDGERATSARCYLTEAVRARANFAILDQARVDCLLFKGRKVRGVRVTRNGQSEEIAADQVILTAGAIHSPAILLRSGLGPAEELAKLGIPVLVDRPGVGRDYQNHSLLHFALTMKRDARMAGDHRQYAMTGIRFSSRLEGCPAGDLFLYQIGRVSNRPFGPRLGMVAVALYAPFSRGAVTLASPNPDAAPLVDQRLLSDPRDAERMVIAARFAESLICDQAVRSCYDEAYLLPREPPLRLINDTGLAGAIKAQTATMVLDAPGPLRRAVLDRMVRPGRRIADGERTMPLRDDEILAASGAMFHPSCTCRIGAPDDPEAVVDAECRVYGVEGLRVADASVMPKVPSANTNIPTIMIAERASEMMRKRLLNQ